jgi:hypothetical protein
MSKKGATQIVDMIVKELTPLESEERQRIIQASLTLLGEAPIKSGKRGVNESDDDGAAGGPGPSARSRVWMKQNGLSVEQVSQVFHISTDDAEIIAHDVPGKTRRDKVRNAYILIGVARYLFSGDARFDDDTARVVCERYGFYDHTNHMKYMKGGNEFTGSKEKGWILTAPGLKHGAAIVQEIADGDR